MTEFIKLEDLDHKMEPGREWLDRKRLSGILFIEVPNKGEFDALINQIAPNAPIKINIAHGEFNNELSFFETDNSQEAFRKIFNSFHEEVFVEIISEAPRTFLWFPSEHKFYGVFSSDIYLMRIFKNNVIYLRKKIISFANEPFFEGRTQKYILEAVSKYFIEIS